MFRFFLIFCLIGATISLYSSNSKVQQLTTSNFHNNVIRSKSLWLVEFYSPGCPHCRNLVPEYEKLASALDGIFNIGSVDTQAEQSLAAPYNIRGVPSIKLFGLDKANPIDYQGGRTAQEMMNFMFDQAKKIANTRLSGKSQSSSSKDNTKKSSSSSSSNAEEVVVLTDNNFEEKVLKSEDPWFIEFYAPWCGHCKQLQPEWDKLPKKVGSGVKIGKLDATTEQKIASKYQIKGYPSIKFFPSGSKTKVIDYDGGRTADQMTEWLSAKNVVNKPVMFSQLLTPEIFENYCKSFKGACVIAFVPHIYDSSKEERKKYIDMIEELAKKNSESPLSFLWSQGGDQFELEEALALGSGYPALVAINFGKNVYSVMRSSFVKSNVESYLRGLLSGKEATYKINGELKVKKTEKWDGKDKQKPNIEDL